MTIQDTKLRLAVVHRAKRSTKVCGEARAGKSPYHFIEFMACPGGCVCGGGQPLMPPLMEEAESRANSLYAKLRRRLSAIEND